MVSFTFPAVYSTFCVSILNLIVFFPCWIVLGALIIYAIHEIAISFAYGSDAYNFRWNLGKILGSICLNEVFLGVIISSVILLLPIYLTIKSEIHNNQEQETNYYTLASAYAETLQTMINEDPTNEELGKIANDFNFELARFASRSQESKYAQNFTGNYNWNNINPIAIPISIGE